MEKSVEWKFLKIILYQTRIIINSFIYPLILVVSLLTYMITKGELSPEEINGMALDMIMAGVDTVSAICSNKHTNRYVSPKCLKSDFRMTLKNGFGKCSLFVLSANG